MRSLRRQATCAAVMVAAMAAAAVLSACGGLPSGGAVHQGSLVGEQARQPARVQPDGPAPGASPDQIVRGFVRAGAGAGFDDNHATARLFFTRTVKDRWSPDSGVKVYGSRSGLTISLQTPTTVRVSASIVAEVDAAGHYREMPAGTSAQASFRLEKRGGDWRILEPPKGFGVWLSEGELDRAYRAFSIAYASTFAQRIVSDRRWFPVTTGLATTLAQAQLTPVPGYLAGAVQTGIPTGTTLAVDSVPVESSRAVVDLSASALSASPDLRRAMWAQFVMTLRQVAMVTEVSLEVDGSGLDLPDTPDRVSDLATLGYQSQTPDFPGSAVLRVGSALSRVSPDRPPDQGRPFKAPAGAALPTIPRGWVSLALSWDGQEIAGVGGDQRDLARWQGTSRFQLAKFGSGLTKPSYDSMNGLWVAGQAGGAAKVWVIDTSRSPMEKAEPRVIPAPWLANRAVLAVKVASDNLRMALITSDRAGRDVQVVVAGIVRSAKGVPVSLVTEPLRVGWTLTDASDLTWVDDRTLAVVGRVSAQDAIGPHLVEIGGKVTVMPPVTGSRLVTNTGGLRGVVVITDRGQVLARVGRGWQVLQTGTDFLIRGG